MRPHRQQPTRLPCPWDSPGKNTGMGCHFLLQCMKVKNESEVAVSRVWLLVTPWTAAYQAPPSMGFSRQEYWSGVPLPSPCLCASSHYFRNSFCAGSQTEDYLQTREAHGNPLKYSCLENPMDGGTWWAAVHGVAKSRTRLSDFIFTFHFHALEKEMATHSSVLA